MKKGVNSYRGLTTDVAADSITKGFYIDALDIRLSTDKGESQGAITNILGNVKYFELPTTDADIGVTGLMEIIGATSIRNVIIFFTADDSGNNGWIFKLEYDDITQSIIGSPTIIYKNNETNFSKNWPIEAKGRFESDCIKRVYWTDYNNYFRSINIEDSNLAATPVGLLDLFPNVVYTQPLLNRILGGGAILSGNHQYAYRLITFDGKETLISPPSAMIHTTENAESEPQSARYNGNTSGQNTFKAHEIIIDTSAYSDFEKIELIHVFHPDITGTPQVLSVETRNINGAAEIIFIHTNTETSISELDLFEYTIKQHPFKTVKTMTQKDSSLVVANIKGSSFDIEQLLAPGETFESLTRRYRNNGVDPIGPPVTPGTPDNDLENAFNEDFNEDSHWEVEWHKNKQYKFQSNGLRLGGEGPNINYNFNLEPYIIDGDYSASFASYANVPVNFPNFNDGYGPYTNTTYDGPASPFRSGTIRGYKRGETYRFGIIFYNKKGEASFVEYIGDIKFPDISETDSITNTSGTNYFPVSRETSRTGTSQIITTAYSLGIEFSIDFSTCPSLLDKIESYQIVRVKREQTDSRRLCSGIMKNMWKVQIVDNPTSGSPVWDDGKTEYDLRGPDDSEDIVHLYHYQEHRDAFDVAVQGLGNNANFATLNEHAAQAIDANGFKIHGSFLTFYSPDVSHRYLNTIGEIVSGNACLLMTGRYAQYYSSISTSTSGETVTAVDNIFSDNIASYDIVTSIDTTGVEGLGQGMTDHRKKMRTTARVDKVTPVGAYSTNERGIEYVKQWNENRAVSFHRGSYTTAANNGDIKEGVIKYNGTDDSDAGVSYYIRNCYGFIGNELVGLNWHRDGDTIGQVFNSLFCKGASGITGTMKRLIDDPYTGSPVSVPPLGNMDAFASYITAGTFVNSIPETGGTPLNETTLDAANYTSTPCIDILIPRAEIYGGYSKDALESNTFMPASPVISKSMAPGPAYTHTFKVYGGDVFINMWVFQSSAGHIDERFYHFDGGGWSGNTANFRDNFRYNRTDTECFAVESRVNTDLSYGTTTKTGVTFDAPGGASGIKHTRWRQETGNWSTDYGKGATDGRFNMYLGTYYTAYSIESDDVAFFIKPQDFDGNCNLNDIRAYISDAKINSETIDSWTKFGINNFYDIDDYGPINKILNWRDNVYFFQDKGSGQYSINPRAIVSTDDGIPTELGSGEGFKDHKYFSNENGAIHQWAIKETDRGIYYYDGIHKKIFRITEQNSPLSEQKGMHSFLKNFEGNISLRKENGGDNPIINKGVHVTKDEINNEVLFTFLGTNKCRTLEGNTVYTIGDIVCVPNSDPDIPILYYEVIITYTSLDGNEPIDLLAELLLHATELKGDPTKDKYTLVFDEVTETFSSRFSATPPFYIENGDLLLSVNPNQKDHIYQHNKGNWGEFYANKEESFIKLVLNEHADINKVLRTIEFNSIVRDNNKNIDRTQTITAFRVETEYQDTEKTLFSSGRVKRRFDKWRLKIPRDQKNPGKDRLRSTYFTLTLYFDNQANKELILDRILYYFDIQIY